MGAAKGTVTITITCTFEEMTAIADTGDERVTAGIVRTLLNGKRAGDEAGGELLSEVVVDAICRECECPVDPLTRRHADEDGADCPHDDVPEQDLDVVLQCPACGGQEISEVNVGEIWDPVTGCSFDGGMLTITVDQLSEIDRNGDGWVCGCCRVRLRLPSGYLIGFEYD